MSEFLNLRTLYGGFRQFVHFVSTREFAHKVLVEIKLRSFIPQSDLFHFSLEIFLKCVRAPVVVGVGRVVESAVVEYPGHVRYEQPLGHVVARFETFPHRAQVHRILDVIVVVRHLRLVDRLQERPGRRVVLYLKRY